MVRSYNCIQGYLHLVPHKTQKNTLKIIFTRHNRPRTTPYFEVIIAPYCTMGKLKNLSRIEHVELV